MCAAIALAGCGGAGAAVGNPATVVPAPPAAAQRGIEESNTGLPGESNTGLPGALFGCPGVPATGLANCTIAVDVNISPNPSPSAPPVSLAGFTPAELQSAYGLPATNPGTTVAIVDAYDDPAAEADLAIYRLAFGLPACTSLTPLGSPCFRKVNESGQPGPYPAANTGWAAEIALDLDMVSAGCPNCKILLVEGNSASIDDLGRSVDEAVALGATVVSNSYYAVEWPGETSEEVHYMHPGVAITVASGDRGYASYPAVSANVTAVGGTSLVGSGGSWSETAWNYDGRGCSAYIAKPSWQTIAKCAAGREGIDMAVVADPQTGVATFCSVCTASSWAGGWYVAGGTSVGAPLIAAAYALSGHPTHVRYSYEHASSFTHVGTGPGIWHNKTGLGAPAGVTGL